MAHRIDDFPARFLLGLQELTRQPRVTTSSYFFSLNGSLFTVQLILAVKAFHFRWITLKG